MAKVALAKTVFFPSCQFNTCLTKDSSQISQSIEPIVLFARIHRLKPRSFCKYTQYRQQESDSATYRLIT